MGAEIPDGVFAYKSKQEPMPLSELEKLLVVTACGGNTGWHHMIHRAQRYAPHLSNYAAAAGGLRSVATFFGLLSAGLVLALREPLLNIAGWLFIIWKRPFRIGDRIQVGKFAGDVIDIRLFQFSLNEINGWVDADQATGRVVHIPNLKVFTEPQANYNYGFPFIWNEVAVRITFESNWSRAKAMLQEIVERHGENLSEKSIQEVKRQSQQHLIFYEDFSPQVYMDVVENGIKLTMRYMCSLMRRRKSENAIWEDVLKAFSATEDIQFAYPTTRFYKGGEEQRI